MAKMYILWNLCIGPSIVSFYKVQNLWLGYQPMHKGRTWIEERKQRYRLFLELIIYNNH